MNVLHKKTNVYYIRCLTLFFPQEGGTKGFVSEIERRNFVTGMDGRLRRNTEILVVRLSVDLRFTKGTFLEKII